MNLTNAKELIAKYCDDLIDICPHCDAKAHIEKLWADHHTCRSGDIEFYVVFRCKPCERLLLRTYLFRENQFHPGSYDSKGWRGKYPMTLDKALSKQDTEHIPELVLSDYEEALKCEAYGANKASCSMFRRSLQGALVELGADDNKKLVDQINMLEDLPKDITNWAHQIRIFGNWGAHPDRDNLKDVDSKDVAEAHDFISKFFMYTFVMPKKVEASRKKRDAKLRKDKEG